MNRVRELKEELLFELADIALAAMRKEGGVFLSTDEWYKAREELAQALRGLITV